MLQSNKMTGTYNIYLDKKLVGSGKNTITTNGKDAIRKYLAGAYPDWASIMAVGLGNTHASSSSDISLEYEIDRQPIVTKTVDNSNIVVKASFPINLSATIYEIGVFPTYYRTTPQSSMPDLLVTSFEESVDGYIWDNGVSSQNDFRYGTKSLKLESGMTSTIDNVNLTIGGYNPDDQIQIFAKPSNASKKATITFYDYDGNSQSYEFSFSGTNWQTSSNTFNSVKTGSSGYGTINRIKSISITSDVSGSQTITINAIKFYNYEQDLTAETSLVSRAVLSGNDIITKEAGQELDIEYVLTVN